MIKKIELFMLFILIILSAPLVIYLISFGLNYVSKELLNYTDSSIDLWMRTIATLLGTFIGPFAAVKGSIYIQRKNKKEEESINEEYSKKIINLFIIHEIKNNFKVCNEKRKALYEKLLEGKYESIQLEYNQNNFKTDEFDKVKYELIKYNNDYVREAIEIYYMFDILKHVNDLNKLSEIELNNVREVYIKNFDKYYKV